MIWKKGSMGCNTFLIKSPPIGRQGRGLELLWNEIFGAGDRVEPATSSLGIRRSIENKDYAVFGASFWR